MALAPGTRLGSYDILSAVGAGGMGEVYRARDVSLQREVAIKILPDALARDPERIARFRREAQVLASLNHPHIAQIYGLEESSGASALVMEFVSGEDLAQRIARGPIPLDEALQIAGGIAQALEAAHAQGITHRDLKPANIKVRGDGAVKVLDFGLARVFAPAEAGALTDGKGPGGGRADQANSPTITSPAAMTAAGIILGTAAYMSPEQARGRPVDARADIWAFGCVLHEMLTGRRLFDGASITDTLAEVLKKDIDFASLPPTTPLAVRRTLQRCLQRDPERRLHHIADARIEIEDARSETESLVVDRSVIRKRGWVPAIALGVVGLLLGIGVMWTLRRPAPAERRVHAFTIPRAGFNFVGLSAISPDGRWLAYSPDAEAGPFHLYLRSMDGFDERLIATAPGTALNPFFSPDSQWVAYFNDLKLFKVPVAGGDPQLVLPLSTDIPQGVWAPDGTIVVSGSSTGDTATGLLKISEGTTAPTALTTSGDNESHQVREILPDGRTVLFTMTTPQSTSTTAVSLTGGQPRLVLADAHSARYSPTGHMLFQRPGSDDIMAVRFDPSSLEVSGEPVRIATVARVFDTAAYAVSRDGTLIYSAPGETADFARYSLVAVDRTGAETMLLEERGSWAQPRVAPDGRSVLYRAIVTPRCDLWTLDLARGTRTRVTLEGDNHDPIWHPNGKDISWDSQVATDYRMQLGPIDRSRSIRTLAATDDAQIPHSWTRDGGLLAFVKTGKSTGADIWLLSAEGGEPKAFATTRFSEDQPAFSPDGKWIASLSNETGRNEVYIQPLAGDGGRLQISTSGGTGPMWSPDGKELFYAEARRLMGVDVQLGASARAGRPRPLVEGPYAWERPRNYDITPDGRRFIFVKRIGAIGETSLLRVILNWPAHVAR